MLLGLVLYGLFYYYMKRTNPLAEGYFWIFYLITFLISYREEREQLDYWINPGTADKIRVLLLTLGFKEVDQNKQHLLFRRPKRWIFGTGRFAIVSIEETITRLWIDKKFEQQADAVLSGDLYKPKSVPDRHWLLRPLSWIPGTRRV